MTWTDADAAELDVLIHALTFDLWKHREECEACRPEPCPQLEAWHDHKARCVICQGLAPLTYGATCEWRQRWLVEHRDCIPCNPCPHLKAAIAEVLEWREARILLSRRRGATGRG